MLELVLWLLYRFVMFIITYGPLYCLFALKFFICGIPSCKFLAPPLLLDLIFSALHLGFYSFLMVVLF